MCFSWLDWMRLGWTRGFPKWLHFLSRKHVRVSDVCLGSQPRKWRWAGAVCGQPGSRARQAGMAGAAAGWGLTHSSVPAKGLISVIHFSSGKTFQGLGHLKKIKIASSKVSQSPHCVQHCCSWDGANKVPINKFAGRVRWFVATVPSWARTIHTQLKSSNRASFAMVPGLIHASKASWPVLDACVLLA